MTESIQAEHYLVLRFRKNADCCRPSGHKDRTIPLLSGNIQEEALQIALLKARENAALKSADIVDGFHILGKGPAMVGGYTYFGKVEAPTAEEARQGYKSSDQFVVTPSGIRFPLIRGQKVFDPESGNQLYGLKCG